MACSSRFDVNRRVVFAVLSALALGGACVSYGDKASLGRLFGRETLGVLGILDEGIAAEVALAARCVDELSEDR